jgi:predicted nucleotidyltransferase
MMKELQPFLNWIVEEAIAHLNVSKIYLFGSRARKTHSELSDFDLAFDFPEENDTKWGTFSLKVQEEARTLRKLDLVNLRQVSQAMKDRILAEGELIYGSRQSKS